MNVNTRPVVVGVDGSASALKAVRLATGEAATRGRSLRIVHALLGLDLIKSLGGPVEEGQRRDAEQILKEAAATAAEVDPGVSASSELVSGTPAAVLLQEAPRAELLVIGDRGLGGFSGLLLGSVAVQVTAHSATPVLVCKGEEHAGGRVVVGVDGSPDSANAIDAAFTEAALRHAELCAAHTWTGPASTGPGDALPLVYDAEEVEEEERRVLAEALAGFRERFADVTVQELLIRGHPAHSLLDLSNTALLLVVGSRGRGALTGLLGSVSQRVLHHSSCPVLIVPGPAR